MGVKEQLLHVAIDLFREKGYRNVTIQEVCDICHVTKGTFYYYYRHKESVLMEYYRTISSQGMSQIVSDMLAMDSNLQKLWHLFSFYINSSVQLGPEVMQSLLEVNLDNSGKVLPTQPENTDPTFLMLYRTLAQQGQKSGEIREEDPDHLLRLYMMAFIGALCDWSTSGGHADVEGVLYEIFLRLYQA